MTYAACAFAIFINFCESPVSLSGWYFILKRRNCRRISARLALWKVHKTHCKHIITALTLFWKRIFRCPGTTKGGYGSYLAENFKGQHLLINNSCNLINNLQLLLVHLDTCKFDLTSVQYHWLKEQTKMWQEFVPQSGFFHQKGYPKSG